MKSIQLTITAVCLALLLSGCAGLDPRTENTYAQQSLMARATDAVPVPEVGNFLARQAVAKQVKRLDEEGKRFYVYILGSGGQYVGYYIASTRPVSMCALLTPSQELVPTGYDLDLPMEAPSLDGVYGGKCSGYFFFDAKTDAYVEITGLPFFVSDSPLAVEAKRIKVSRK